ncbi:MAG: hypothetical protein KKC24_05780 [Gammaproteobacteria bacterium]|nr:hypothetical protein [Gammaproteobacteria bacterium]MBU0818343.1 hypothetical protein [Gammaproteobacteria bacterium]MBU0843788.1 hypothetical protein [Gammaproteobacteria bacterium]MBU1840683.1 hypothetical protein [Gammaproteobacteria bacterium]
MSVFLFDEHPYWSVRSVIEASLDVIGLCFSYYTYTPQSLIDERTVFSVSRFDFFNENFIRKMIYNAPIGQELAIHSTVALRSGHCMHLPMIDMSTGSPAQLEKVRPVLGEEIFSSFDWYKSGRSYHGYGRYLMGQQEWATQMGKLLLVNQTGLPPTVDPRWVGHRLIAGYAALRWTKNTAHYVDMPRRIHSR